MITAGIDMGSKTTKVVILKDNDMVAKSLVLTGFEQKEAGEKAFAEALAAASLDLKQITHITATGAGRKSAPYAKNDVTEVGAGARGILLRHPGVRTLIDVGAEEGRAIKCAGDGKVADFAVNEKCAAGAGTFVEAMARALELKLEDMGPLSLQSAKAVPMNAQCTVFAESEVVSLIHSKVPKTDIARAIHDAIASRIVAMARRVGVVPEIALIGGVAYNAGFVDALKRGLEAEVLVPADPEYVGALGAALIAADNAK
jgi:benzoyl-CoA reductase subunit D